MNNHAFYSLSEQGRPTNCTTPILLQVVHECGAIDSTQERCLFYAKAIFLNLLDGILHCLTRITILPSTLFSFVDSWHSLLIQFASVNQQDIIIRKLLSLLMMQKPLKNMLFSIF